MSQLSKTPNSEKLTRYVVNEIRNSLQLDGIEAIPNPYERGEKVYERLSKAEEDIGEQKELIGNIDRKVESVIMPRLEAVEKINSLHENEISKANTEITAVKNALQSFELTVMKDGQHTRDLLNQFVQHYFSADGKAMMTREKTALMKLSGKEKIWLAVIAMLSSGGITAVVTIVTSYLNQQ